MNLTNIRTATLIHWAFALAAAACVLAGLSGWKIATLVDDTNAQAYRSLQVQNALSNALRSTNELILTGGSKVSVENFQRAIQTAERRITEVADEALREAARPLLQSAQGIGGIKKISPDNDEAMIAFGKLEAQSAEVLKRLDTQQEQLEAAGSALVGRLLLGLLLGGALLAAGVVGLAWLVVRRLHARVGGSVEDAQTLIAAVAGGDFSVSAARAPAGSMIDALGQMVQRLSTSLQQVHESALTIQVSSSEVARGSQDLSQRTEAQAGALEETAATMAQLGTTVHQNADNATQANQLAQAASGVAIKGGEVVGQVVQTMKGISESSKKISDIIGTIDGIAFQTNILALNAAVEAARAGEQGRGFAVVASEVRGLAQRSAEAAKEIKNLISASTERVEQGTALVDQAGQTMGEVVASIRRVTDIMGEISSASALQSSGVAQVGQAVSQMDHATQQNAALVEESAAAAESLKSQAGTLVEVVGVFKLAPGGRLPTVPASAAPKHTLAAERRGPGRATNVTRPAFGKKPASTPVAAGPVQAPGAAHQATFTPQKTGTDDGWDTF